MKRNQVEAGKPWPFELLQAMVQLYYPWNKPPFQANISSKLLPRDFRAMWWTSLYSEPWGKKKMISWHLMWVLMMMMRNDHKETEKDSAGSRSIVRLWSISPDTIVRCTVFYLERTFSHTAMCEIWIVLSILDRIEVHCSVWNVVQLIASRQEAGER